MTQPRKLSSQARLRIMSRLLSKRHGKWYAAVEQSGLSASNFIFSLLVLRSAGVASLGEYGFWFVMCQLMAMTALGLAIRQMVLQSADRTFVEQRARFVATCLVVLGLQLVQAAVLATLISLRPPAEGAVAFAISVTLYTALLNFSELVRQYLYMRNRHRLSVLYTAAALSLSVFGFAFVSLTGLTAHPERDAFWFLAIGHGGYSLIVVLSLCASAGFWHFSRSGVERVVLDCWRYGRPATAGMAVTWIQNQSVTPMLMLMMGPIAVGYYQIARMIITPVNMITQGLSKSALPHIRRAYGDGDEASLTASIAEHMRVSMRDRCLLRLWLLWFCPTIVFGSPSGLWCVCSSARYFASESWLVVSRCSPCFLRATSWVVRRL